MSENIKHINCPNCGEDIDVNEILAEQVEDELEKKFQKKLAESIAKERTKTEKAQAILEAERAALEKQKDTYQEKMAAAVSDRLKQEKTRLESKLKEENEERFNTLQSELREKSEQVKALNKSKAEIEKLKREKDELKDKIELEAQQKLSKQLSEEREKLQKTANEKALLKVTERDQVIQQLNEQIKTMQRKAEQGSMQLQGEVQEIVIEDWLRSEFPLDEIEEIKKGQQGADCLQHINTRNRQNCGSIYYESKRTKAFSPAWIEKFKADIQSKKATIGVLITQTMPKDMPRLGQVNGVWICSFDEFKNLSKVLRQSVIQLSQALVTQENKGDKMEMIYDFFTGNEFKMQVESIVEAFTQMQTDLNSEKRAIQRTWKQREKQIDKVIQNTVEMYGSVKGIAGSAVQAIPMLELEQDES